MNLKNKNILIVGDTIVDAFIHLTKMGNSVESVPTYREVSRQTYMGGAANVAKHCLQLGARVMLIDNDPTWNQFRGDDALEHQSFIRDGLQLTQMFVKDYLVSAPVTKQRFYVDGEKSWKVNVFDQESADYAFKQSYDFSGIFAAFLDEQHRFVPDLCIAADNRHGMFSAASARSLVEACRERNLRLLANSQWSQSEPDHRMWKGASELFVNEREWDASYLSQVLEPGVSEPYVHWTLGAQGSMRIKTIDGASVKQDGFRVNVVDTLGAGDAYLAAWAVTGDICIANAWAALSCTRPGTELPRFEELEKLLATAP